MAIKAAEGTFDLLPEDVSFWDRFRSTAFEIFGRCGYRPIETPLFEQTDLFVRGIGEATDVVSKEMFTVVSGGNLEKLLAGESLKAKSRLSLRPEGTAGVVRAVVQHDLVPWQVHRPEGRDRAERRREQRLPFLPGAKTSGSSP